MGEQLLAPIPAPPFLASPRCRRLQDLLPVLKMKELTAAGVGLTRLGMPPAVTTPLVAAFEAKARRPVAPDWVADRGAA